MNAQFEDKMWNMIGVMGWVESGHDFSNVENVLLKEYTDDSICNLKAFIDDRLTDLYSQIEQYEEANGVMKECTEDKFVGMVTNVIGMGKMVFDAVMKNPSIMPSIEYKDGFLYSIPQDLEYARQLLTLGFHQEQAANCLQSLMHDYDIHNLSDCDVDAMKMLVARMIALIEGDVLSACNGLIGNDTGSDLYGKMCNWPANHRASMYANTLQDAADKLIH